MALIHAKIHHAMARRTVKAIHHQMTLAFGDSLHHTEVDRLTRATFGYHHLSRFDEKRTIDPSEFSLAQQKQEAISESNKLLLIPTYLAPTVLEGLRSATGGRHEIAVMSQPGQETVPQPAVLLALFRIGITGYRVVVGPSVTTSECEAFTSQADRFKNDVLRENPAQFDWFRLLTGRSAL